MARGYSYPWVKEQVYVLVQQGLVLLVPSTEVLQELVCELHYLLHPRVFSLTKKKGLKSIQKFTLR